MRALAKWILKNPKLSAGIMGGTGLGVGIGGTALAKPYIDEAISDQAIDSLLSNAENELNATVQFAQDHPTAASLALGGSALLGQKVRNFLEPNEDPFSKRIGEYAALSKVMGQPPNARRSR